MYRVLMCAAFAGVLAVPAKAQSLREQLIGAWTLVSCPNAPDSVIICGTSPNGIQILDASGQFAATTAARGRPKANIPGPPGTNRDAISADDYKAIARGVIANFGTWSVNEADKTITYHLDGALFPNGEGADLKFNISVTGDEYRATGTGPRGDVTTYRRIKG